jgi:hypothetical protein
LYYNYKYNYYMEAIAQTLGLGSIGSILNKKKNNIDTNKFNRKQNNKSRNENTNTRDIYSSNNTRFVRDEYENKSRDKFRQSRNFRDTKVVPRDYSRFDDFLKHNKNNKHNSLPTDSDSVFSDTDSIDNSMENYDNISNYSVKSDDGYRGINPNNPSSVIDKMTSITNNRKFESCVANPNIKKNKFNEKNTWVNQFEQMTFDNNGDAVSSNSIPNNSNIMSRIEMERQMELDGGFSSFNGKDNQDGTYGVVPTNSPDFIHENMVPFVRKSANPIQENKRAMVNQRRMELFTGSADNPDWRPKVERAPLFSPLIGAKNIYGDPVRTDEYTARYFPGKERANELPFQQVKVTPGLDISYNAVGKQGYHDMYRCIPRAAYTDLLRTLDNPKKSYGSYVGPGQKGEKGPVQGQVAQYKTPKFRERGTKDMIRGRSYISAPTVYGEYDPKNLSTVNRGVIETPKIGPAKYHQEGNTPGKYRGNFQSAKRENYKYDHPRNLVNHESLKGNGHNNNSFVPDETMRNIHNKYDRSGQVSGNRKGYKAIDFNDIPDQTMRNVHNKYDRSGQVKGNSEGYNVVDFNDIPDQTMRNVHNKFDRSGQVKGNREGYNVVDYNDIPDQTMRNVHNKFDRSGQVKGNREGYNVVDYNDIPNQTMRNIHNKYDRSGQVRGNREGYNVVDYNDIPDQTMRNVHNKYDRSGQVKGNREGFTAINFNDIPDQTMRNVHNKYDRSGQVKGNRESYKAINFNDISDQTMRNIHNKYDRSGQVKGNRESYKAINFNDIPDQTMREIHSKYDRAGNVKGNRESYKSIDWNDIPDITMREIHPGGRKEGAGGADANDKRQGSRHNYMNMKINGAKEALEDNRAPTKVGMNKGWTIDHTSFELCKNLIPTKWRPNAGSNIMYNNDQLDSMNTNVPLNKFWINDRILSHAEENLQGNSLVNNLIHKSI